MIPPASRNAPCPCGSGRRYKECHGVLGAASPAASPRDDDPDALFAEGQHALDRGDFDAAVSAIDRAIAARPGHALSHILRGHALVGALRPAEAEEAWGRAHAIDPSDAEALFCLGNIAYERGAFGEAIGIYERAVREHPDDAFLLHNLGLALERSGDDEHAGHAYERALATQDPPAEAHANFARLLQRRRDYPAAARQFELYLSQTIDAPAEIHWALAVCQHRQGNLPAAEGNYRKALERSPEHADIKHGLATALVELGQGGEAVRLLAELRKTDPARRVLPALAFARQLICDWTDWDAALAELKSHLAKVDDAADETDGALIPLSSLALPLSPPELLAVARRHASGWIGASASANAPATIAAPTDTVTESPTLTDAAPKMGRRLRIGYVSSDFRPHPIAYLLTELWEQHDRDYFEVFGYSIGPVDPSPLRQRIERAFEHFIDVSGEAADATLRRIRDDRIDILIDLNGYTSGSRMELFAARAAPIQMHWLGFLGTLGAPWFDYIVTDRFVTPPELQPHFTERFLHVPDGYTPGDTRRAIDAQPQSRGALGLPDQGFVYCCFNNAYKIVPAVFDAWMRILAAVEGSVLWLSPASDATCANLQREAEKRGVAADRLVFAPRAELSVYLARLRLADLFLDTWPYNAGATANDALFVGLPLLTRAGDTMASRVAASQLRTMGVPELVTYDSGDYERMAIELARAPGRLHALRERLRAQRSVSPLFDMQRYVRGFESALTAAWDERWRTPG